MVGMHSNGPDLDVVKQMLVDYKPQFSEEEHYLAQIDGYVSRFPDIASRHQPAAHLTASAWLTTEDCSRILLLHHAKLGIWVQPGGHVEDTDISMESASYRELTEETGIASARQRGGLFDIDVHRIPARKQDPTHLHLDLRFWFVVPHVITPSGEEANCRWFSHDELLQVTSERSILRMLDKTEYQPESWLD